MTSADLVFRGATVQPIVRLDRPADAVAVSGGRIVAVGESGAMADWIGPRTEVVDLSGETLLPGFQDAHIHPIEGGLLAEQCDLHDIVGATAYVDAIARYAAAHPERGWIEGSGWSLSAFAGGEPSRELLDRIVPDRPVLLESNDGHVAWVNTLALELAGVTASTATPHDGRIARDDAGNPAGALVDGAIALVARLLPEPTHAQLVDGLRAAQRHLHALGITAWQDAHVEPANLAVYREAARDGWLTARVVAAQWWNREAGLEQIDAFDDQRAAAALGSSASRQRQAHARRHRRIRHGLHGSAIPRRLRAGVAVHRPRCRAPGGGRARSARIPGALPRHRRCGGAARAGCRRRGAALNGASDRRHHIAHLEVVHPDDLPRFAALDVVANLQPFWAVDDDQMQDLRIPALGSERAAWQFPFGSLRRAGARLAAGSDWTVTTANPLLEIEVAVHRVAPDARGGSPFLPTERLTLDEALAAFTLGSAFVNHLDHETGSIEVGKLADIVVLDRNIHEPDAGPIGDASVRATYVAGRRVA